MMRGASFIPAGLTAGWAWDQLHQPFHYTGLIITAGLVFTVWPLIMLAILTGPPALLAGCVPSRWRAAHRRRHGQRHRRSCPPTCRGGRAHCRGGRITARLRRACYAADRHACLYCGGAEGGLQVDHGFAWSLGGLATVWNLFTLCGLCNRVKSNYHRWPSGRETYRAWQDADSLTIARAIARKEARARWNLARWWRAAWALGL